MLALHHVQGGPEPAVPASPGGFAWWYLDLVDEAGRGLVLIWSFGLPFLPGYGSAARAGRGERPVERPSVNVALYDGGSSPLYLLQEVDPGRARADGGRATIGDCRFHTVERDGQRQVEATLDCPLPGTDERLLGTVRAAGPALRPDQSGDGVHRWTPLLTAARGSADLRVGARRFDLQGRVYHDRNVSADPLDRLGIDVWLWGRLPVGEGELVWYVAWPEGGGDPEAMVLEVGADGVARVGRPRLDLGEARRAWFGMRWWPRVSLTLEDGRRLVIHHDAVLDDGPFYLRLATRLEGSGSAWGGHGIGEIVCPARIDRAWERPLVRMAVHHADRPNSIWLPLFCGLREDRLGRLLAGFTGRARPLEIP